MFTLLSNVVFQVSCGNKKKGTAFLINESLALTAYHVILGHDKATISLSKDGKEISTASLHELIDDTYKSLDLAILKLSSPIKCNQYPTFVNFSTINTGTAWLTRGYPSIKDTTGANLNHSDYTIHQQLNHLEQGKFDLELNHNQKFDSFEGLSGAPLIIDNSVAGIINSELIANRHSRELNALTVKHFKNILEQVGISVIEKTSPSYTANNIDYAAIDSFKSLDSSDKRDLPEKLRAACNDISDRRVKSLCRELASGKTEMSYCSDQEISSIKYRVFEVCQKELINFIENQNNTQINSDDIEIFINTYSSKAKKIIEDKSSDYKYPLKSEDFLRKIVLDLINECFLSFDEMGIYED